MPSDPRLRARSIAVIGATGVVGAELVGLLGELGVDPHRVQAFAPARADCRSVEMGGTRLPVFDVATFHPTDRHLVFLAVDSEFARPHAKSAIARGARVIDLSSAHREDPTVPLVVPEINSRELSSDPQLVASPNCCATILLAGLAPLLRRAEGLGLSIEEIRVTTYQAVSGAGRAGMDELLDCTRAVLEDRPHQPKVFPVPSGFNVFPHESPVDSLTGRNGEEDKILRETHKILGRFVSMEVNCTRVPVPRVHSEAVSVRLSGPVELAALEHAYSESPGIRFRAATDQPFAASAAASQNAVFVSRLRASSLDESRPSALPSAKTTHASNLQLWILGDQLRKGAALNALQIASAAGWLD